MRTVVLVLRSGGDFGIRDVELIARHINGKWKSAERPRILCFWDKASEEYNLGNFTLLPLKDNKAKGTWSRIQLYAPEMEKYKPFLYVDLDTAVINSIEHIFDVIRDESQFITLEDFYQKNQLATGLVWFPKNCAKTKEVWKKWKGPVGNRMDYFLRNICTPDTFFQRLTGNIHDFKPKQTLVLKEVPANACLVCFHGKPRIFDVAEASMSLRWVDEYVNQAVFSAITDIKRVSVIIPYKEDRGWLEQAINSVPKDVELILSQGEGNWPQNFNRGLEQASGDYIKYLHEDDMLTPNCIEDSLKAIEGFDFIHGDAIELTMSTGMEKRFTPVVQKPTFDDLLKKNVIHSATLMYRRDVFERVGPFNESDKVKSFEEYEFNLRCLDAGLKIGYSENVLAIYRRHPEQIIRTVDKKARMENREELINSYR